MHKHSVKAAKPAGRTRRKGPASAGNGFSIYEVARQAAVSVVTVSRVFNDYPHVSKAMRARVLEAARLVGYQPRLVSKRNLLAVVVGGLDHLAAGDQTSQLMLGLVRAAAARGYLVEFMPAEALQRATQNLVDGLLVVGLSSREVEDLRDLPPVPRLILNNQGPEEGWSAACIDPASEVEPALRHFLAYGHRNISLVMDASTGWQAQQREQTFIRLLSEAGLDNQAVIMSSLRQDPYELARLVQATDCTACLCLCSGYGLPVLDGLQNELNLRVPEDISLIATEHGRISTHLNPRLTTVEQPLEALAEAAVEEVVARIRDPARKEKAITLKSRLISRDSVHRLDRPGR